MEENKTIHNYEVAFNDGAHTLMKDGNVTLCPFPPPYSAPSKGGTHMEMRRFACATICPLAEVAENDGEMVYIISCCSQVKTIKVKPQKPEVANPLILT